MTRSRPTLATALCVGALILAGCAAGPSPALTVLPERPSATLSPSGTPVVTLPPADATTGACVDGISRVNGASQSVTLAGDCDRVEISGNDLTVDLTEATARDVVIRGDRNDVEAEQMGAVDIEGNDNEWDGDSLGSLSVRGDRNDVDVDADLGAVTVGGNDNVIEAGILGAVDDTGQRNRIVTR